jgi:PAS domain S-box-containing protein
MTALRQSAESAGERLKLMNAAVAIASWDLDVVSGRLRWAPDAGALGLSEGAPSSLALWLKLVHPDDRQAFRSAYERALDPAGDGTMRLESRILPPDGVVRRFFFAGRTYFEEGATGRTPIRQLGAAIDVMVPTERERSLEELAAQLSRAEASRRELIELAPDAFFVADLDGRFTIVNQAACRMLGYERGALIGKTILDIISPDDAPRLPAVRAALLASGEVSRAELALKRSDGTFLPVEVSSNILSEGRWQAVVRDISRRRRMEDELRESENKFRTLAEAVPQIVWITRPDGWNTYFNQQWVTYTGLTLEESYGHGWNIPFHPEDRQRAWDAWQQAVRTDGVYSLECRLRRADGTYRWWLIRGLSLHDESGKVINWFGTCTDVDDIKRTEEALRRAHDETELANQQLRQSEERFRLIVDEAPIGMALVTLDGHFTRVNGALCDIVGYTAAELQRLKYHDITHPADLDSDLVLVERLTRGEIPRYQLEKRYIRKDGEIVVVMLSVSILRGPDGVPLYYISQIEDITERKRTEREQRFLAEAGAVLASSLDYAQTLSTLGKMVVRDFADWCIVDVVANGDHPTRLKVVSADPGQESLSAQLERIPIDGQRPRFVQTVWETRRALLIERMTPGELESLAQSAEHLQLLRSIDPRSVMGLPLLIRGELLGVLVLISSASWRVYGPSDLRLAQALADRAALAIENGSLYETAVRATRLRDEVLGIVAHDLRNPLAAITMQAAALQRQGSQPERRDQEGSERILQAANRMSYLIRDLLDVTLIEAGRLGIDSSRVPTRKLLVDFVEAQRPLASSASLELQLEVTSELPDVRADQHRLLQVLENLVGNAIKFTPRGGRVTVGAIPRQHEVLFWVADTGCGIPPEGLPHVFDRFWQARKGASQGAGLGLPITRGIVEAHGGRIWVESSAGCGSKFFFTIPAARGAEVAVPRMSESSQKA